LTAVALSSPFNFFVFPT